MFANVKIFAFYFLALFVLVAHATVIDQEKRDFIGDLTAGAGSIFGDVKTVVESVGGEAVTVITGAGGQAFTLASEGAGVVTSIGGSLYTVATGELPKNTQTGNAALGVHAFSISAPLLGGLLTVLSGIFMGAWVVL
ncbi:hypothetical protein C8Q80DRAFT_22360 [Daedaleopsis nitida]|nr:hypothetical protein C8Q80DRAFT_22360 [Daedaleopsis nitida]